MSVPDRIRTCGLLFRRETLYPLSYGDMRAEARNRTGGLFRTRKALFQTELHRH